MLGIFKRVIYVICVVFVLACVSFELTEKCSSYLNASDNVDSSFDTTQENFESKLDKYALHYDATGPLVVIDKSSKIIGIYDGRDVIDHIYADVLSDSRYIVSKLGKLEDDNVLIPDNIIQEIEMHPKFDESTPVVVIETITG